MQVRYRTDCADMGSVTRVYVQWLYFGKYHMRVNGFLLC